MTCEAVPSGVRVADDVRGLASVVGVVALIIMLRRGFGVDVPVPAEDQVTGWTAFLRAFKLDFHQGKRPYAYSAIFGAGGADLRVIRTSLRPLPPLERDVDNRIPCVVDTDE